MRLFWLCIVVVAGALFNPSPAFAADSEKPNVLFIAVDDLNDWVSALGGHPQGRTPNIDRLAERGMLFTNAHCSAPVCNASRTSLLFGVRPSTSGVYTNAHDWRRMGFFKNIPSLPMHFKNSGYKTLRTGKMFHAHTFNNRAYTGHSQPEAWHDGWPSKSQQMPYEQQPPSWPLSGSKFYGGYFDWGPLDTNDESMADRQVVAWAQQQMMQPHDQPVFLAVGIYRPHVPWWNPREYFDAFPLKDLQLPVIPPAKLGRDLDDVGPRGLEIARQTWHAWIEETDQWEKAVQAYLASMLFCDKMIGLLLDTLDRSPMADNTVIVLWSDHGYHHGEKEHWEKYSLWDDATRVPFIVVAPRVTQPNTRSHQPVSLLDIYPTLVELCGLDKPSHLEGQSVVPLLKDPSLKTGRAVVTTESLNSHGVRGERWRYIRYPDGSEELYDHASDPHEWTNLAGDTEYDEIKAEFAGWIPRVNVAPPKRDDPAKR
ncbi:MAG: sulfatase [Planctomycetota bacterium]|jgi:arylsulfatase A-like enzyme